MADLGPLKPLIDHAGMIVNCGFAVVALVVGKFFYDPPIAWRALYIRILALVCGLASVSVWWLRLRLDSDTLFALVTSSGAITFGLLLVYGVLCRLLIYKCPDDSERYLGGLRLQAGARKALRGEAGEGAYSGAQIIPHVPPTKRDYFCNCGKDPSFVWQPWSIAAAETILCSVYAALMLAGTLALTAGATLLMASEVKVEETATEGVVALPADVLFAFDQSSLQPDAVPALERAAAILMERGARVAMIGGHTDDSGDAAYNQKLSERRAAAVESWLRARGVLYNLRVRVVGFGETQPCASNITADGKPDEDGRKRNRRVEITFDPAS